MRILKVGQIRTLKMNYTEKLNGSIVLNYKNLSSGITFIVVRVSPIVGIVYKVTVWGESVGC